ncbi:MULTISPECIES: efflux RND transporter periplasmic adaptor subunit [Sphingomonadales]|uniref:Efflux RND transporter periplasmic adaptor subunit n=2 Tax=Edaphosphingomonas TaxID=3423724 RepID=A0A2T4HMK5_9SPHN|nr:MULTISPECIES: efflux RND transporter periplasmic adaptor subunit [Sphingomonas]AGH51165.1 RND family efflux transporter MFP subunit [Sphingomonas sp. MM-1]MDX3885493.1 efflux RND transporter periplasmic adaptor subunit [Sphingomonas sp.]OHT19700.1 Multidrug resistance protein MexA precursor [Sphingomonas haloaromaticamans]PTD16997.1 efflux RND transporter periplasmic adaptor subunit [Sphingomonas fennica]
MSEEIESRKLKRVGIGAAVAALAVVAIGISARTITDSRLKEVAAEAAIPSVDVVRPTPSGDGTGVVLPGSIQAFNSAAIYARTNGYVRRWTADIGDNVAAGQTLAILDAPEVDQQLAQAEADYQTALANQALARTTSTRWAALVGQDAVSRQEADEKAGDYAAKTALANAARANVNRLRALQGFTRLTAPFAGIVSSRSAQIGALVVSGNAAAQPLFTVSDVHRMRVYVRVPQGLSAQIRPGMHASMTLPEYPGRTFDAVLQRTADAVDTQSGTVLVELQADNPDRALKPGAYAQVSFPVRAIAGSFRLPASTLIFGEKGPTVAIVDASNKVTIRPVVVGRDEGREVEVTSGLAGTERIIDTPPDAVQNGDHVRVNAEAAPGKDAGKAKAPAKADARRG